MYACMLVRVVAYMLACGYLHACVSACGLWNGCARVRALTVSRVTCVLIPVYTCMHVCMYRYAHGNACMRVCVYAWMRDTLCMGTCISMDCVYYCSVGAQAVYAMHHACIRDARMHVHPLCICVCPYACMRVRIYTSTRLCASARMRVRVYWLHARTYGCMYLWMCSCTLVFLCSCILVLL